MRRVTVEFVLAMLLALAMMSAAVFSLEAWTVRTGNALASYEVSPAPGKGENGADWTSQVISTTPGECGLEVVKRINQPGTQKYVLEINNTGKVTFEATALALTWPSSINGALKAVTLDEQVLWGESPIATSPAYIELRQPGIFKPRAMARFGVEFTGSTIAYAPYTFVITGSTPAGKCVFQHVEDVPRERFKGPIQELPSPYPYGNWKIAGKIVEVNEETEIIPREQRPKVGDEASVVATRERNKLVAISISWTERKDGTLSLSGIIADLPDTVSLIGLWYLTTTDSMTVPIQVEPTTTITYTQRPQRGDYAYVEAKRLEIGVSALAAQRVVVETPADRQKTVQFEGPISSLGTWPLPPTTWIVGGITVTVTTSTIVTPVRWVTTSALVEVRGRQQETGEVQASSIHVRPPANLKETGSVVFVTGTVEALPPGVSPLGEWTISTPLTASRLMSVTVDEQTVIDESEAKAQKGARVEIRVQVLAAGRLRALRVTVRRRAIAAPVPALKDSFTLTKSLAGQSEGGWANLLSEIVSEANDDASHPAIALDGDGLLHLVYVSDTPEGPVLRFRYRQGTTWVTTPFEITNGRDPVLATDSQGRVHLAYTYETISNTNRIQYRCRTPGTQGRWFPDFPRDPGISESLARPRPAIAIGRDLSPDQPATPHITWAQGGQNDSEIYHNKLKDDGENCPDFTGASPIVNDPFQDRATGTSPSLAVDDHDRIHVAWQDLYSSTSEIFYSRWGPNAQGQWSWSNQYIVSALGQNWFSGKDSKLPSVAVEPGSGAPHLAWEQILDSSTASSQLYYAFDTATLWYTPTWSQLYLPFDEKFLQSRNPRLVFDGWTQLYLAWVEGRDIRVWSKTRGTSNDWQETALVEASTQGGGDSPALGETVILIDSKQRSNQV